jgi:hypothetical protein
VWGLVKNQKTDHLNENTNDQAKEGRNKNGNIFEVFGIDSEMKDSPIGNATRNQRKLKPKVGLIKKHNKLHPFADFYKSNTRNSNIDEELMKIKTFKKYESEKKVLKNDQIQATDPLNITFNKNGNKSMLSD